VSISDGANGSVVSVASYFMEQRAILLTIVASISLAIAQGFTLLQPASLMQPPLIKRNERKVEPVAIKADQLRKYIIRPALTPHGLWSRDSEELLMLTAAKESHLGYYIHQLGDGPALSPWQIEPATFDWLCSMFPQYLRDRESSELVYDLRLGALAARVRYLVDSEPLPAASDVEGMARTWKRVFNTVAGKGTWQEASEAYYKFVVWGKQ
jgi:hypothetical protein